MVDQTIGKTAAPLRRADRPWNEAIVVDMPALAALTLGRLSGKDMLSN